MRFSSARGYALSTNWYMLLHGGNFIVKIAVKLCSRGIDGYPAVIDCPCVLCALFVL